MKSRKLVFLVVLTLLLSMSGLSFTEIGVVPEFAGGDGSADNPWQIATAEQLSNVRNYVGETNTDKYFILTADINLNIDPFNSGTGWLPIGTYEAPFMGSFDGGGYTISGLYINTTDEEPYAFGLFGETAYANIHDLDLTNVNVSAPYYVGALVGYGEYTNFSNIVLRKGSGTDLIKGTSDYGDYVGGIAGYLNHATINNCSNDIEVQGAYAVGGLAGEIQHSTLENSSNTGHISGRNTTGGLIGAARYSDISYCSNTGSVYSDYIAGGLVGDLDGSYIAGCYSNADISGKDNIGGLLGAVYSNSEIYYSHSEGTVSGEYWVGGLAGSVSSSTIGKSYSNSTVASSHQMAGGLAGSASKSTIQDSYAQGNVTGVDLVGGLVASNANESSMINCYATGAITGITRVGGLVGSNYMAYPPISSYHLGPESSFGILITEEQMKTQSTFVDWDFDSIWNIEEGETYPFHRDRPADRTVVSVETLSDITVPFGTLYNSIVFPAQVEVTLSDGSTTRLDVIWDGGIPAYDAEASGTYVFTGYLVEVFGISNPDDLDATVNVIVEVGISNQPPVLQEIADVQVQFKSDVLMTAVASDPDGDTLIYSISSGPEGAIIDEATGEFVWSTTKNDIGEHVIIITVSDGSESDSEEFLVTVTNMKIPDEKPENPEKPEKPEKPPKPPK